MTHLRRSSEIQRGQKHRVSTGSIRILRLAASWLLFACMLPAQGNKQQALPPAVSVPAGLQPKVKALGSRFQVAGQERITLVGSLTRMGGSPVTVTIYTEFPRKFRYEEQTKSVVHDGSHPIGQGNPSQDDSDIVESFLEDTMDGIIPSLPVAKHLRLLMNWARGDGSLGAKSVGPYFDIYEMTLPSPSLGAANVRRKHYYFDSQTHLLDHVAYFIGPKRIETQFKGWHAVNGNFVPGTIVRVTDGAEQLRFTNTNFAAVPAASDGKFANP